MGSREKYPTEESCPGTAGAPEGTPTAPTMGSTDSLLEPTKHMKPEQMPFVAFYPFKQYWTIGRNSIITLGMRKGLRVA